MRLRFPIRFLVLFGPILLFAILFLHFLFNRTIEFRAQAQAGQPIAQAIEQFHKQTGGYPASLTELLPNYLPATPAGRDLAQKKFAGWDYHTRTNGAVTSYTLRYYMGRGGVEYEPPIWYGNNEGHRTVILKND